MGTGGALWWRAFLLGLPVVLSCLLLAAHFSRADVTPLVVASLLLPGLLCVKRAWAARVIQLALVLGGFEWVRTLIELVGQRRETGEPFIRLALILGAIAALTFLSALLLRHPLSDRRVTGNDGRRDSPERP